MKYFSLKEIEEDVNYILAMNEMGQNEAIEHLMELRNVNSNTVVGVFKNSIILWAFYIKLADQKEQYELSAKILRVVDAEKEECMDRLLQNNDTLDEEGLEYYLDSIIAEVMNFVLS